MSAIDTLRGRAVLMTAHVAGMVDMVALPVWVGTLVQHYGLDPQKAGGVVTLFLVGVVVASMFLAPRFDRLPRRWMSPIGYAIAAVAFYFASTVQDFGPLAALHVLGGLGVGCALSFTHGTMGRSANPHRLFAYAQSALGVFAVFFLGAVPQIVAAKGGAVFFSVLMVVMLVAMVVAGAGFPVADRAAGASGSAAASPSAPPRIPGATWLAIAAVLLLTLNQAMMFSFLERVGMDRGFGAEKVNLVLLSTGILGLIAPLIAAALQKRLNARAVALAAPVAQTILAVAITQAASFGLYAAAGGLYPFVTLFAHTFLFGLIAHLDPSGRAVAATPAMVMSGSAIGPFLAGSLVVGFGYEAIGVGVAVAAVISIALVSRIPRASGAPGAMPAPALH